MTTELRFQVVTSRDEWGAVVIGIAAQSRWRSTGGMTDNEQHMTRRLTALIEREGDGFVALCPEVDVASQGSTVDDARENLREAVELFFETASPQEIQERLHDEVYVTSLQVAVG